MSDNETLATVEQGAATDQPAATSGQPAATAGQPEAAENPTAKESAIVEGFISHFEFLRDRIYVLRKQRVMTKMLSREEFEQVIHYAHDEMGFSKAHHVIGTDEGADLGFIYLLSNQDKIMLGLRETAPKSNPRIRSMNGLYPSLLMHERELVDLFGAIVENLPPGPTYPLPDGWPKGNYPLRKEWNPKYFDQKTMTYNPPPASPVKEDEEHAQE
jgi:membrane-bound hydrogenase subunit beta